jgi:hypothetical protein
MSNESDLPTSISAFAAASDDQGSQTDGAQTMGTTSTSGATGASSGAASGAAATRRPRRRRDQQDFEEWNALMLSAPHEMAKRLAKDGTLESLHFKGQIIPLFHACGLPEDGVVLKADYVRAIRDCYSEALPPSSRQPAVTEEQLQMLQKVLPSLLSQCTALILLSSWTLGTLMSLISSRI